jgi:iron complex outermembrane receptor protein
MDSFNNQEALEVSIKADWDLGWADLTAWGLYSDIDNNLGSDGTSAAFGFFWSDPLCRSSLDEVALSGFQLGKPQVLVPQGAFGPGTGGPEQSVLGAYTPTTCDGTQYQERNQTRNATRKTIVLRFASPPRTTSGCAGHWALTT